MKRPTLILMLRWPAPGRCKTRLAKEIGFVKAAYIQNKINEHTIAVAKELENKGLLEIQLAVSGLAPKAAQRWGNRQGIRKVTAQGKGSLGLRMRKQIIQAQRCDKKQQVISKRDSLSQLAWPAGWQGPQI